MASGPVESASGPCIFCDIVARKSSAWIVYEDERTLAFLDLFPFTRGHLLVVPKRHVDRLVDLPADEFGPYLSAVAEVCRRVERLSHHYNVAMNQGALAGQIAFHLHVHIIPRYGDVNPFRNQPRVRIDDAQAQEIVGVLAER
jgi:histidine triad (HIT) family protein